MKTLFLASFVVFAVMSLTMTGCSDDGDCTSCPELEQQAFMSGEIWLYQGDLLMKGGILGLDAPLPHIDSLLIAGERATIGASFDEAIWSYEINYAGPGADAGISSGDRVDIKIFTGAGLCSSSPKVLDRLADKPIVIEWSTDAPFDTVALDSTIEIRWNRVAGADWYEVRTYCQYRTSQGWIDEWEETVRQTDTVHTLPDTAAAHNGYHQIVVGAFTGPYPNGTGGNISGGIVKGWLTSSALRRFEIFVGVGIDSWSRNAGILEEK